MQHVAEMPVNMVPKDAVICVECVVLVVCERGICERFIRCLPVRWSDEYAWAD